MSGRHSQSALDHPHSQQSEFDSELVTTSDSPRMPAQSSTTPSPVVHDAARVQCTRYGREGPIVSNEPLQSRGVEVPRPRGWIRGQTAPVEYTYRPLEPPAAPSRTRATLTKRRQADVRVRRALRDAWCDPARARKDVEAAGAVYADIQDEQGLAMAFIAHAQTRLGDMHLSGMKEGLGLAAIGLACEESSHAHAIYTSLLQTGPLRYDVHRHPAFEKAAIAQRFRPWPLTMTADDAAAASVGFGL